LFNDNRWKDCCQYAANSSETPAKRKTLKMNGVSGKGNYLLSVRPIVVVVIVKSLA